MKNTTQYKHIMVIGEEHHFSISPTLDVLKQIAMLDKVEPRDKSTLVSILGRTLDKGGKLDDKQSSVALLEYVSQTTSFDIFLNDSNDTLVFYVMRAKIGDYMSFGFHSFTTGFTEDTFNADVVELHAAALIVLGLPHRIEQTHPKSNARKLFDVFKNSLAVKVIATT